MKNAKRWLSVLLSVAVVLTMAITPAMATGTDDSSAATITVETVTKAVAAGEEVTLKVSLADNPGFAGLDFTVEYDQNKLELKDIVEGDLLSNGLFMPNAKQNKVAFADKELLIGDGVLFTLKFTAKADSDNAKVNIVNKGFTGVKNESFQVNIIPGGVNVPGTTGSPTTGGSTTGGSTTGGSTTGGSTTGGSTTGGSTTGGSTTGGSTTGGSTTGGSTTGSPTTGSLTGKVSITGTLKFGEVLTASLTDSNNTGDLHYEWFRDGVKVSQNNTGKYTLVAEDIGKAITVKVFSSVQTGKITSTPTAAVDKADGPAAPAEFTLGFTLNSDGTTYTATIPTVTGGEYSFDGKTYSSTNTKADCAANTSYTGYVRIAETSTHKASTAVSSTLTSPKLTVAAPTFTPNGASSFTGTQSVTISCTTAGAKIYYTTDGTMPTVTSALYTTALSLTSTTTVKAIAVKDGMNNSAVATATFTKYSGGGGGGGSYTPSYTVSVNKAEHGSITVSPKSASNGTTVTITVTPDQGYALETLKALDKNGNEIQLAEKNGKYTFTMPAGNVEVKAIFEKTATPPPAPTYYSITVTKDGSGTASASHAKAAAGTEITLTAKADTGYTFKQWQVVTGSVTIKDNKFTMPAGNVEIKAIFEKDATPPAPPVNPFVDVPSGSFYYDAVLWAVEKGVTKGTSATTFEPEGICTRAQAVTFLWRVAGCPAPKSAAMPFTDVKAGSFYYDAVLWAVENGITKGTSETTFEPEADCTRAQIVTLIWRAQKTPAAGTDNPFNDVKAGSFYETAVLWAVEKGVTKGTSATTFEPEGICTRAQIVTLIWRCMK